MLVSLETTQPYGTDANLPISVANLKTRLRITTTEEDDLLKEYIRTATLMLESYCRRSFVEQTHVLRCDEVGNVGAFNSSFFGSSAIIYLGRPPVISVTSVKFFSEDGTESTVTSTNYYVDTKQGRIMPSEGYTWQSDQRRINALEVTYTAGMVAANNGANLPYDLISAVAMLAGHLYEHRTGECDIPDSVKALVKRFRLARIGIPYMGVNVNTVAIRSGSLAGGY